MNKIHLIIFIFFIFNFAFANEDNFDSDQTLPTMSDFLGRYTGLGPSGVSEVNAGELVLNISEQGIHQVMASYHKLHVRKYKVIFKLMSNSEVRSLFEEGADYVSDVTGFSSNGDYPYYLFQNNPESKSSSFSSLTVIYSIDSFFGKMATWFLYKKPVLFFYNQEQVKAGLFNEVIEMGAGKLPLIKWHIK